LISERNNKLAQPVGQTSLCSRRYERGELVTGTIYVHPIDDEEPNTVGNIEAFELLCGDRALRNTAIVTSKWDPADAESVQRLERLEQELRAGPFARLVQKGARMFRDDRGKQSAREVVEYLIQKRPTPLQIQRSIVDGNLRLQHTRTGHILLRDLSKDSQTGRSTMLPELQREESRDENERTSHQIKLRRVENKLQIPKRRGEKHRRIKKVDRWTLGDIIVFVCCGAAFYAFMTVLRHHIWHGMDTLII